MRTHHPGQPMPQELRPRHAAHNANVGDGTPHHHTHFPAAPPALQMPRIHVIDPPSVFPHNVTIRRTNIKPAELQNFGSSINPPELPRIFISNLFTWLHFNLTFDLMFSGKTKGSAQGATIFNIHPNSFPHVHPNLASPQNF